MKYDLQNCLFQKSQSIIIPDIKFQLNITQMDIYSIQLARDKNFHYARYN